MTPFARSKLLFIISSSILLASSKSFFASLPYVELSKIEGYLPFNSHVKKNGVQSIFSLIFSSGKFSKTFLPVKVGLVIFASPQLILNEFSRACFIVKYFFSSLRFLNVTLKFSYTCLTDPAHLSFSKRR